MAFEKHLLVDGANVAHAWPALRPLMKRDRGLARTQLAQQLMPIHDHEGVRVTLVFDGRGPEMAMEFPGGGASFAVVQTPAGTTADDVIEQLVSRAADPALCTVATDDQAERSIIAAAGGWWVSSADLAAWCERAGGGQRGAVAASNAREAKAWRQR